MPGIKCVVPSTPADAKGLLLSAIRDDDLVVVFENKVLYNMKGEVPEGNEGIPLGKADIKRPGADVTVVALSRMVQMALAAADELEGEGIDVEVVDPRTLSPLDEETILESAEETGRVVIVDEASPRCGLAADIASIIAERAFGALKSPILKVTPPHTPVPYAPDLEQAYLPDPEKIAAAARQVMAYGR